MITVGCFKLGISYAIVTKVKELTELKQYGEALDLLEGEDIFQSLNPQFLRCCGEVYLETNHFLESRKALVQAHVMAPEAVRVIYDLVHLYLKMGYYTRAKHYYDLYECFAPRNDAGKLRLQYMLQKAQRVDAKDLLDILKRACEEEFTDDWGFELALLYASLGMQAKAKEECIHLMAAFRNSPYYSLADSLKKGEYDIGNSYFCFPLVEVDEDRDSCKEILAAEDEQWEKDDFKIHPPEPVILQMEDDDGSEEEPHEKAKGFRFSFGKKKMAAPASKEAPDEKMAPHPAIIQQEETDIQRSPDNVSAESGESELSVASEEELSAKDNKPPQGDVSTYIESVMKSVADIEASVEEELQNPTVFDADVPKHTDGTQSETPDGDSKRFYQPKLTEVEDSLSPKERLEKLMRLIEADREEEEQKKPNLYQEEDVDMDEFLMNLVGASTIAQAMVNNYREEQQDDDSKNDC